MKLIKLYFYTLIDLNLSQIFGRLFFNIYIPKIKFENKNISVNRKKISNNFFLNKKFTKINNNTFYVLNKKISIKENFDWQLKNYDKLIAYNIHYFDFINSYEKKNIENKKKEIIQNWIRNNKRNNNNNNVGWDSYPVSLRLVNWIKYSLIHDYDDNSFINSLFFQTLWLSKRIEYHLQGNHLIANAKALVFAGLFFNNKKSKKILNLGINLLLKEINNQILDDGGHYERSSMYQSLIVEDILDIVKILRLYEYHDRSVEALLLKIAKNMMDWLSLMSHHDEEISFFNDSTFGIANNIKILKKYYKNLTKKSLIINSKKINLLKDSQFLIYDTKICKLIANVGGIISLNQPAHSHGDSLSFELSLFGKRLIVNSGISSYEINSERIEQRSAAAHNTLVYDNKNSNEVWSSFRVGKKAKVFKHKLAINQKKSVLNAVYSHDGYSNSLKKIVHKRQWCINNNTILIKDFISDCSKESITRFYFHPDVILKKNYIVHLGKKLKYSIKGGKTLIKNTYWYPQFYKKFKNKCLEVKLVDNSCELYIDWSN